MSLPSTPVEFSLTLGSLASERDKALEILQKISTGLEVANCATVFYRFLMGRQLLLIQRHKLWMAEGGPETWDGWVTTEFPRLTEFSPATGYAAMQLARCKALADLNEDTLRSFRLLQNALRIARIERRGEQVTPELIQKAISLPADQFRMVTGDAETASVEVLTNGLESAKSLTRIVDLLKSADPESLDGLAEQVDLMFVAAGGNPTDLADGIRASIELNLQNLEG